jgi:hypothetical protein
MSTTATVTPRIGHAVLDHIAHAVPRWQDVWHRYATDLGAVWSSGGPGPGFAPAQLQFANGARVEVLMPWAVEVNDFLSRFLAANGPGPHHLTFKVPDLAAAMEEARAFGIQPIGIDVSDPGVVVQLAQANEGWSSLAPDDYPTERRIRSDGSGAVPPAALLRACHVVADLDTATALFGGLLDGQVVSGGASGGLRWIDLAWPGPLGVRLVGADTSVDDPAGPVARWLGGRSGRVHHVTVVTEEPNGVPGAVPAASAFAAVEAAGNGGGAWEIDRADNAGLGVVLIPPGADPGVPPTGR